MAQVRNLIARRQVEMVLIKFSVCRHQLILVDTVTAPFNVQVDGIVIEDLLRDQLVLTPEPVGHEVVESCEMHDSNCKSSVDNASFYQSFNVLLFHDQSVVASLVHHKGLREQEAPEYFHLRSLKLVGRESSGVLQKHQDKN